MFTVPSLRQSWLCDWELVPVVVLVLVLLLPPPEWSWRP
jgi:hypothetical protein